MPAPIYLNKPLPYARHTWKLKADISCFSDNTAYSLLFLFLKNLWLWRKYFYQGLCFLWRPWQSPSLCPWGRLYLVEVNIFIKKKKQQVAGKQRAVFSGKGNFQGSSVFLSIHTMEEAPLQSEGQLQSIQYACLLSFLEPHSLPREILWK